MANGWGSTGQKPQQWSSGGYGYGGEKTGRASDLNPLKKYGNKVTGGLGLPGEDDVLDTVFGAPPEAAEFDPNAWASQFHPDDQARLDEDRAMQMQARGLQGEAADFFRKGMLGEGPSVAEGQLSAGVDAAGRAARSAAASARGSSAAGSGRAAARAAAQGGMQAAQGAAQLRAQEQQAYAQQFAGLAQAQRQQDSTQQGYSTDQAKAILDMEARKMEVANETELQNAANSGGGGILGSVGGILG